MVQKQRVSFWELLVAGEADKGQNLVDKAAAKSSAGHSRCTWQADSGKAIRRRRGQLSDLKSGQIENIRTAAAVPVVAALDGDGQGKEADCLKAGHR